MTWIISLNANGLNEMVSDLPRGTIEIFPQKHTFNFVAMYGVAIVYPDCVKIDRIWSIEGRFLQILALQNV